MDKINRQFLDYAVNTRILDKEFINLYVSEFMDRNNFKIRNRQIIIDETYPYEIDIGFENLDLILNPRIILDKLFKGYNLNDIDIKHINLCYLRQIMHLLSLFKNLKIKYNENINKVLKMIISDNFKYMFNKPKQYREHNEIIPIENMANIESLLCLINFMEECHLFDSDYDIESYKMLLLSLIKDGINNDIVSNFYNLINNLDRFNRLKDTSDYSKLRIYDKIMYGFKMKITDEEIKKYVKK